MVITHGDVLPPYHHKMTISGISQAATVTANDSVANFPNWWKLLSGACYELQNNPELIYLRWQMLIFLYTSL